VGVYSAGVCRVGTVRRCTQPGLHGGGYSMRRSNSRVRWLTAPQLMGLQPAQGGGVRAGAGNGTRCYTAKQVATPMRRTPKELTALGLHSPGYLMSVLTQLATCRDGGRGHTCVIMVGKQARSPNECSPAQQLLPCQTRVVSTEGTGHAISAPG
jgi:hypothetical protein